MKAFYIGLLGVASLLHRGSLMMQLTHWLRARAKLGTCVGQAHGARTSKRIERHRERWHGDFGERAATP